MEYRDPELEQAESAILQALQETTVTYSPRSLVEHVKQQETGLTEEAISLALWDLIGTTQIKLSQNWKLSSSHSLATV